MELKKVGFELTDVTVHSRGLRPTQSFERAQGKARLKGSEVIRVVGAPKLLVDPKTMLVYLGVRFSDEIAKKLKVGGVIVGKNTPLIVDKETQNEIVKKKKRWLKNFTRVWRKNE